MTYDDWKTNAPDPGSVDSDDRCPNCGALDGEDCDPECGCESCERVREITALDVTAGEW